MALTSTGYRRRTFEEILNAKVEKAKELFGETINTEGNTALGKYIRINAYDQYNVEELAEQIYYSAFPQTSSGQSLDRLGWNIGISRNAATASQYQVKVSGTAGAVVEMGFLVGTESELNFYNTEEATIGEDGTCLIVVECVEAGIIGNVSATDINKIVNPAAAIDTVIGVSAIKVGVDRESDYDFLKRYEIVREGKGSCTEASIISALANIPTVSGAYIIVNESATETVNNVPPKTIACYVDGGNDYHQEIAEAIFDKKPVGVGTYGTETVYVSYGALTDYAVKFSHSKTVKIYVQLELTTSAEFEVNGNKDIKANIQRTIDSLGIGKSLITTALYSQIYSVAGVSSAIIQVSTNGTEYSANNIEVNPYESCTFEQITINGVVI